MRGFTNIFKKDYVALNLDDLSVIFQNDSISIEDFKKKGVIKNKQMIKILGNGEVSKSLSLEVHAISSSAKAKIEKAVKTPPKKKQSVTSAKKAGASLKKRARRK